MIFQFRIPPLEGNKIKLAALLDFLKNPYALGTHTFLWECPISKTLTGIRMVRSERNGDYYREPYPLTMELLAPHVPSLPSIVCDLDSANLKELISSLMLELSKKW